MNFFWNFFTSPKEPEQKQHKPEPKNVPDLKSFEYDFNDDKVKESKSNNNEKNSQNNDFEPIEEIKKDSFDINTVQITENEDKKNESKIINDSNNEIKEKNLIQNNNNLKENVIEPVEEIIKGLLDINKVEIKEHEDKKNENEIINENNKNESKEKDLNQINNNDSTQVKKIKKEKKTKVKKRKKENKDDQNLNIIQEEQKIILIEEKNNVMDKSNNLIQEISDNQIKQVNEIIKEQENKMDLNNKNIIIEGPENSPYENGKFEISINYDKNENLKPILKFITKIYHYNIAQKSGEILCPFVWNKNNKEEENIENLKKLLLRPDTRFPCSNFIKDEYYNNYPSYKEKAQRFTENYSMN